MKLNRPTETEHIETYSSNTSHKTQQTNRDGAHTNLVPTRPIKLKKQLPELAVIVLVKLKFVIVGEEE